MNKEIINIVKEIAKNLGDYADVKRIVGNKNNVRVWGGIELPGWEPLTLSHGIPGICLLYGKLMECFPEEEVWANMAHQYLGYLVEEINKTGFQSISMFSGTSGIGLAIASVSNNFRNYKKLLNTVNSYTIKWCNEFIDSLDFKEGTRSINYDIIEGLTGILSYCSLFHDQEVANAVLVKGLQKLVTLTNNIEINGYNVPGWYIPSDNQFSNIEKELYPYGNFNTSFSHGIAGPLTLLSEMKNEGIIVDGQNDAIQKIIEFLFDFKLNDGKRDFWKGQIDLREYVKKELSNENIVRRDAWCYGNPGICYAIIKAGQAMNNPDWIKYGIDNLKETLKDIKGIFSPTFCHGFSGLYQIVNSIEMSIGKPIFNNEKKELLNRIMEFYDPMYSFGFKNVEVSNEYGNIKSFEYIGLLDGAVGVCLALLEGEYRSENIWKRAFLLL